MRILLLCNNWVGWQVAKWLREKGEHIVGLVIHQLGQRKFGEEILASVHLEPKRVFEGSQLQNSETLDTIKMLDPDIGVSAFFAHVLNAEFVSLFPCGVINLHPGYLPYNRGAFPNVWSIVDRTHAGATLHYVDSGIDTGDIIARRKVPIEVVDTGQTLYSKLENACVDIFKDTWPKIRNNQAKRIPQRLEEGSYHKMRDVEEIDQIDLYRKYYAGELVDLIRARTFPPHRGAYFVHEGRKIFLRLQLFYEDED
jgi:methionyl-tRNA formyltransferase